MNINFFKAALCWLGIFSLLMSFTGCASTNSDTPKGVIGKTQTAARTLSKQLALNITTNQKLRVGIMPFNSNHGICEILPSLQESFKHCLFLTGRFDVVEDSDMKSVLKELKIQEQGSGVLRADTIHHMGELLGADAIIVGTITEHTEMRYFRIDDVYLINCRLIPVKSGVIGSAAETTLTTHF